MNGHTRPLSFFSVEVRLEARYKLLVAAQSEQEAINAAFSEDLPAQSLEDFERELVRVVEMKERVYVS